MLVEDEGDIVKKVLECFFKGIESKSIGDKIFITNDLLRILTDESKKNDCITRLKKIITQLKQKYTKETKKFQAEREEQRRTSLGYPDKNGVVYRDPNYKSKK